MSWQRTRARYDVMKETRRAIDALKMDEAEKARRVDMLHHQIGELERADLQEGEEETLLARRNILRNGEKFISAISEADACLNGGDEGLGAVSAIKEAEDALRSLRSLGDEFITLSERLEALRCEAYDLAETIRDKKDEYDFSPQELDAVESRCDQLYRLKKKYGSSVEEMLAYLEKSREELDSHRVCRRPCAAARADAQKAGKGCARSGAGPLRPPSRGGKGA